MCTKDIHGRVSIDTLDRYSQSTLDQHLIDTQSTLHQHSIYSSITQFCKCHRVGAFDHTILSPGDSSKCQMPGNFMVGGQEIVEFEMTDP